MKIYRHDIVQFLSKLSIIKIWNGLLVLSSFFLSKWTSKAIQWGKPITISFEPTTTCNLKCPECPSGLRSFSRPTGHLKKDFFKETIDQVYKKLLYLIFYFQGEPYINPDFLEMVEYASKKGIYTITSTNGHYMNDANAKKTITSGLDRIIISVDGTTQETYESYRKGGNLEKVLVGARTLVNWKKQLKSNTPHIIFQFLVVKPNEHQIDDLYKLADEIGVDEVKLKTAQIYDYKHGNSLIPTIDKYSRYALQEDGTYKVKNVLSNNCWKLWHSNVITWDGIVVPCCFDKDATHQLGDLNDMDLNEIWESKKYQKFREKIKEGREQIDICKNCTDGTKVWF